MTPECRQEMQYYKQLAVAVERRINDLRFCLDETTINSNILHSDSEEWCDGINISMVSSKNDYINESFSDYKYDCLNTNYHVQPNDNEFESMNSQLTVIDNEEHLSETKSSPNKVNENSQNKTAKVEQILDISKDATPTNLDDLNSNRLKNSVEKPAQKEVCATKDINFNISSADHLKIAKNFNINIESTKPANTCDNSKNDVSSSKIIPKPSPVSSKLKKNNSKKDISVSSKSFDAKSKNNVLNLKKISKKSIIDNKNKLSPSKNVTGSLNNISSGLSSPPKLVRQNSYTLEYPSPLLLAHLEVQSLASGVEMHSISMSDSTSTSHLCNTKQKNLDSNIAKEVWSSLGSDINSLSLNECSVVAEKNSDVSAVKEASVDLGCDENAHLKIFDQNSNSTLSSAQNLKITKISESQVHYYSSVTSDEETSQRSLSLDTSNKSQNSNNASLKFILKKFEEEHTKKLAELVRKQKEEQSLLQKSYENQQKLLLAQFQSIRQKDRSGTSNKSSSITETENNKCDSKVNQKDSHKQISESVPSQSHHSYLQKTMKTPSNADSVGNSTAKSSPRIVNEKHFESKVMRSEEYDKTTVNPTKEKFSEYTKNKDYSACDTYDNMVTSASANTLDDINITFASDDSTSFAENSNNNTPLYSNVTVREIDGMSKLKSAFDKITRIQQNLASQSSFKYPVDLMSQKTYYEDDCLSNKSQTVSLSSIGTISQVCSEADIHYPVMDRNALSLNLVDISRPQSGRNQNYFKHKTVTEKEVIRFSIGYFIIIQIFYCYNLNRRLKLQPRSLRMQKDTSRAD